MKCTLITLAQNKGGILMDSKLGIKFWILPILGGVIGIIIGPLTYIYKLYPNHIKSILTNFGTNPQHTFNIVIVLSVICFVCVPIIKRRI